MKSHMLKSSRKSQGEPFFLSSQVVYMNYSKAIRVARSLADLSQGELADRANIDRSYLSLIESGKRQPTLDTIEKLAQALRMPFHLLSLLGISEADAQRAKPGQIESLSLALTELLMQVDRDSHDSSAQQTSPSGSAATTQPPRTRTSARRKPRGIVALS
ncbi:helix-turn-helix domain-containing protein [Terriglobus roseus]|uniref:helix-turn-helix domain-containing protein n=1 Tax=Terriglobus roseus TaxID=392734 RepID=UPI0009F410B1